MQFYMQKLSFLAGHALLEQGSEVLCCFRQTRAGSRRKSATASSAGHGVSKANEWDFFLRFSVDLTLDEIRGEIFTAFSAARQSSSELFGKSHTTFFQLFPADFVGILEDWPFSPEHVFMLQCNSLHCISFFHLLFSFFPPTVHAFFIHLMSIHFPALIIVWC